MTTQSHPMHDREHTPPPAQGGSPIQDYWTMSLRDFRRNRLAMAGMVVTGLVILTAVFCPFIANQRPLYIHAVFPQAFDNSLQIVIERVTVLASDGEVDPARVQHSRAQIALHGERLRQHLAPEDRAVFDELHSRISDAFTNGTEYDPIRLASIAEELDLLFDAELQPVTRFPAVRALTAGEVYTLLFFFLVCGALVLRRRLPPLPVTLTLLLLLAGAGTWTWKTLHPTIQDNFNYRRVVTAPGFAEQGGRILRTPVFYGENENIIVEARQPPTFLIPPDERRAGQNWHWLGTDTNGRDVLSRMIYGARVSMLVGIVAVAIYTAIGILLGALAGYFGGWVDIGLSRLIEVVICFPALMLILAVQAFLAPSLLNIILALAALWWTGVARLQRAEFLRLVNQDYVQAVRAVGGSDLRIIFRHILPNGLAPILVLVSFGIAGSILVESGLSFLGFGVPQPMASWGDLLNNGRNDIRGTWWLTIFPGMAIFITVTCFNLVGEGIRDALDPRREH